MGIAYIKVPPEEAIKILKQQTKEDATFNIIGKKSIQASIDAGLITKESVYQIQNIPFTLVLI